MNRCARKRGIKCPLLYGSVANSLRAVAIAVLAVLACVPGLSVGGQTVSNTRDDKPPERKKLAPYAIVEKAIDDLAAAGMDGEQQVIQVNEARWKQLPEGVRNFIYEHEVAHHTLGHTVQPSAVGGFLKPIYTPAQEAGADERASRELFSRGASAQMKEVLTFTTAAVGAEYPLPQWRREQIVESLSGVFENPDSTNDPDAVAFLKRETFDLDETERPEVRYKIVYRNMGDFALRCTLVLATGHQSDKGKRSWLVTDADIYDVTLAPHQSFAARGSLNRDESHRQGQVLYYPSPDEGPKYVSCNFPLGTPKPQKPTTANYAEALPRLLDTNSGGFPSLRGALETESTTHKALLSLEGMEECEVRLNTGSLSEYQCTMAYVSTRQTAEAQYEALVTSIKEALPASWEGREEIKSENNKVFEASLKKGKETGPTIRIWTMHFKKTSSRSERHKVVFELRSASLN